MTALSQVLRWYRFRQSFPEVGKLIYISEGFLILQTLTLSCSHLTLCRKKTAFWRRLIQGTPRGMVAGPVLREFLGKFWVLHRRATFLYHQRKEQVHEGKANADSYPEIASNILVSGRDERCLIDWVKHSYWKSVKDPCLSGSSANGKDVGYHRASAIAFEFDWGEHLKQTHRVCCLSTPRVDRMGESLM